MENFINLSLIKYGALEQSINLNNDVLKGYENYLQVSKASKQTYLNNAKKFIKWNNGANITENTLRDYKQYLISNYKASAINTYIVSIKSFFNFLESQYNYPNYAKCLKVVKVSKQHKKDCLTLDQVKSIYKSLDSDNITKAREQAIFKLLIGTALREIEIVNANISDIATIGTNKVLYIQGKGFNNAKDNKSDYVILEPSVLNAIQDYLKYRPNAKDNEPLFISNSKRNKNERLTTRTIRNIVKGLFKDNGLVSERLTTHSTRHTAITLSLISGATLQETQALARHTNINTTMIYAHNLDRLTNNAESKLESLLNERG